MDASNLPDFQILRFAAQNCPETDDIGIQCSSSWTYCGPLFDLESAPSCHSPDLSYPAQEKLLEWIQATLHHGDTIKFLLLLREFLVFTRTFLSMNGIEHYWLTVRASKKTRDYDVPRWHTDDFFFGMDLPSRTAGSEDNYVSKAQEKSLLSSLLDRNQRRSSRQCQASPLSTPSSQGTNWKLATTLVGPGTLFIPLQQNRKARAIQRAVRKEVRSFPQNRDHSCTSLRCLGCATAAEDVRMRLAHQLKGYDTVQTQPGECVFFRVGSDDGAIHSEPRMDRDDRIFVNVVPGTEEELRTLLQRWGMEFPRAWCLPSAL